MQSCHGACIKSIVLVIKNKIILHALAHDLKLRMVSESHLDVIRKIRRKLELIMIAFMIMNDTAKFCKLMFDFDGNILYLNYG